MFNKFLRTRTNIVWLGILVIHLLLLLKTKFFPYPELFIYPYLTKIGLVPYKQILDQHFPGLMFFPVNLATLGIDTVFDFRVVQLFLVLVSHISIFKISKLIFKNSNSVLFVSFLYLVWQGYFEGGTLWIESFLVPILTFCFYSFKKKQYLLSGLLLGTALISKQVVAPLVILMFLYLLVFEANKKMLLVWIVGILAPVFLLLSFVVARGIEVDFVYWTSTFNLTAYHDMGRKYPTLRELVSMMFIALPAFASLFVLISKKIQQKDTMLLSLFFVTGFIYAYARFDFIHLQPVIPFAILLFVLAAEKLKVFKVIISLFLIFSLLVSIRLYSRNWGDEVKFFEKEDQLIFSKVRLLAPNGSSVFAFGTYPHLYSETNTRPPGEIFVFQFPWFMKIAQERIFNGLVTDPPLLVIRDGSAFTDQYRLVTYMPKIAEYVDRYYYVNEKVGATEIMIRR